MNQNCNAIQIHIGRTFADILKTQIHIFISCYATKESNCVE